MKTCQGMALSLVVILVSLTACSPRTAASAGPASSGKAVWEAEWNQVLAAARQEGTVVVPTSGGAEMRTALAKGFQDAYGIAVENISGRGSEMAQKILSERRAGIYSYDVYMGGSSTPTNILKPEGVFDPFEPELINPEVTDPQTIKKIWWHGSLWWIDPDKRLLAFSLTPDAAIAYNTSLVKEGEIKSWQDLLDPKWKGKIVINDPTTAGAGATFGLFAYSTLGEDFLKALAQNEPQVVRDERLMLEWLARGKVAMVVPPNTSVLPEFLNIGAPIKTVVPKEGAWMAAGHGALAAFNKQPHPNAAKVYVAWLLSKEGQTLYARVGLAQSLRLDVPVDHLDPLNRRQEGVSYFIKEQEKVLQMDAVVQQKSKAIFGTLVK